MMSNYKTKIGLTLLISLSFIFCMVGQNIDTTLEKTLQTIEISAFRGTIHKVQNLGKIQDGFITSGKKTEIITLEGLPANLAEKTGRQIFAKIPGAFIYDMDGSGNQINLSTRGLDPHRSWEFNVRQNGIMTNSDIYGYPASHYSAPLEAVSKVQIIRGTGSLQYGAQFGGMINYIIKQPDTSKIISVESLTSLGSFGLSSHYMSIGGKKGNIQYFVYYQKRKSNGYRHNANSESEAQFAQLVYLPDERFSFKIEFGRSRYLYKVPGPLTDLMFNQNPRQSTRNRNYFNPDIYVPSIVIDWKINKYLTLNWTTSAVLGQRNSLQFIGFANTPDTINPLTGTFKNRQVDIDQFNSYTSEIKLVQKYKLSKIPCILVSGLRFIQNDLHRKQLGIGTTGSDFDLSVEGEFGRDIHFKTKNAALFLENVFQLKKYWDVSLGLRYENGKSNMSGRISYLESSDVPKNIVHNFPLLGLSSQVNLTENNTLYAGWAQAYRPVIFADLIPATVLEKSDPNLKDAFGYNAELGIRGKVKNWITYDINVFQILYRNKIGSQVIRDDNQREFIVKTNIGDSKTTGVELYAEATLFQIKNNILSVFSSTSFIHARYVNAKLRNGSENIDISGNVVESVPQWITRNGLQFSSKRISMILQYNYVSSSYADPFNTVTPSLNGAVGKVPSYHIWDLNTSFRIHKNVNIHLGISNLLNSSYFTKRPTVYPGPGIWSSDGRGFIFSSQFKF